MKKHVAVLLAIVIAITALCSCGKRKDGTENESAVDTSNVVMSGVSDVNVDDSTKDQTTATTKRKIPDYSSQIIEYLGVEPVPSTFGELTNLTQSRKDTRGFYREDEEHYCCTLVFRENLYYVIQYEHAQEWFEYFFSYNDYLEFEMEDGKLIILDEDYGGPEGMLMTYWFRVFVDDSCKFLVVVDGYSVPEADIDAFKSVGEEALWVSVKEFRNYYSWDDESIENELIYDYIQMNHLHYGDLSDQDHRQILEEILGQGWYYELGYSMLHNIEVPDTSQAPEDFIKSAKWIYFEFEFPVPESGETKTENMVFDLRHNKVYFNADTENYLEAEMCAEMDADTLAFIFEELPENVAPDVGNKNHDLEYTYLVYVVNATGQYQRFSVYAGNPENALFDAYWKNLYKMCFGKDHELDTEGFAPEQNIDRRLYKRKEPTLE